MQTSDWGLIGGTAGGVLGLIGGLTGTFFYLRGAKSERERKFILRFVVFVLLLTAAQMACSFYLPLPYSALVVIPYLVVLLPVCFWFSRRAKLLRTETGGKSAESGKGG